PSGIADDTEGKRGVWPLCGADGKELHALFPEEFPNCRGEPSEAGPERWAKFARLVGNLETAQTRSRDRQGSGSRCRQRRSRTRESSVPNSHEFGYAAGALVSVG